MPLIVKDNYETTDMSTSAGSLSLKGVMSKTDAFQIKKLREAGAITFIENFPVLPTAQAEASDHYSEMSRRGPQLRATSSIQRAYDQRMRSARAALSIELAWSAPSTSIDPIVAQARDAKQFLARLRSARGSPARNSPARPFLVPGVKAAMPAIEARLREGAAAALAGNLGAVDNALDSAGIEGVNSVRATIQAGIPPPIKPETLLNRTTGRRAREKELRRL